MIDKVLELYRNRVVCLFGIWDYLFTGVLSYPKDYIVYNTNFDSKDVARLAITSDGKLTIELK